MKYTTARLIQEAGLTVNTDGTIVGSVAQIDKLVELVSIECIEILSTHRGHIVFESGEYNHANPIVAIRNHFKADK